MADSGWGCKSNGANPRWGCKSNFDGAVSPMGRYVHTNWGAQYRGAVSPASIVSRSVLPRVSASLVSGVVHLSKFIGKSQFFRSLSNTRRDGHTEGIWWRTARVVF